MASATSSSSKLRIRPATPADVPDIVRIHYDAFGPGVMNRLMHPDGGSENARAKFGNSFFPPAAPEGTDSKPSPVENFIMVAELLPDADEDREEEKSGVGQPTIVAFSRWKLIKEPLPEEQWNAEEKPKTVEQLGEGSNPDVYNAFIGGMHQLTRKYMKGDPGLHLGILACTTTRQRTGAGSALLRWGTELADREGKNCWLEASPQGYPLYKRFGFEAVDVQDLKITELWGAVREGNENWGGKSAVEFAGELPDGVFRTVIMRRRPQKV